MPGLQEARHEAEGYRKAGKTDKAGRCGGDERASAGFSRLAASMLPSVRPALTSRVVCAG